MRAVPELRGRRKNDPAATRARILDAAFDLFQRQGYNGTSMLEIAAAAGVTGGAMHHHFSTKKAMGLAVITDRVSDAFNDTWLRPVRDAASAKKAIFGIFRSLARQLDDQGSVLGCPVNNLTLELSSMDIEFRAALKSLFDEWRSTIASALLNDKGSNLSGRREATAAADLVIAVYSGAMAMAKVEQTGKPLRKCVAELQRLMA
jgi:TetR/AcrR family transcriptional regulator, transcriptional repressor for nem operon